MKKHRSITIFLLFYVLSFLWPPMVTEAQTPPALPSSFWGEIHFMAEDGGPIAGDTISAFLDDDLTSIVSATIESFDSNLVYSIKVPTHTDGTTPSTVTFKIADRTVAKAVWVSGTNVHLDIHPPKADAGGPYEVMIDEDLSLSGSAADWLTTEALNYAWDLDNDGVYDDSAVQNPTLSFTSAGSKSIHLKVTDGQGGEGFASATVEVIKRIAEVTLSNLSHTYDGFQKSATVTTNPPDLTVNITYNSLAVAPTDAGSYTVVATVDDDIYQGSASDTLLISPATAGITLSNLNQDYDGTPKPVTVITDPAGLDYSVTYNGETDPPSGTGVYSVEVTIVDNNYTGSKTDNLVVLATQDLTLVPGWNLVSFNLQPYPSTAPSDVLMSIDGSFDQVYAWDASGGHASSGHWISYDDVESTTDTLTTLDETLGLWIHITTSINQTLQVKGFMPTQTSIDLLTTAGGWNLVGFPSTLTPAPADSFSTVTQLSRVFTYDASDGSSPWKLYEPGTPSYLNDLTVMETGYGYWVLVTGDSSWDVTY